VTLPIRLPKPPEVDLAPELQRPWWLMQLGIALLALVPGLGIPCLLVALGLLLHRRWSRIIARWRSRGLLALAIGLVPSTILAAYPLDALAGLANWLPYFLVFVAFAELLQTPAQLRWLAQLLVVGSLPIVLLGWLQLRGFGAPIAIGPLVLLPFYPGGNPLGRMASVFGYANVFGAYCSIVFVLALGLWSEVWATIGAPHLGSQPNLAAQQTGRPNRTGQDRRLTLGLWTLCILANGLGVLLSDSRNAWGIAAIALIIQALYLRWRWLVLAVAAAVATVFAAAFGPGGAARSGLRQIVPALFWMRLTDQNYPDRAVSALRTTQWRFAWELAGQHPIWGWGLRNFTPLYQDYSRVTFGMAQGEWFGHPHNLYLMLLAETGWIWTLGLMAFVTSVLVVGIRGIRRLHETDRPILFSYLCAFGATAIFHSVDVPLFDVRINLLGWILLAGILGVVYRLDEGNISSS
jgi:O-antigen ligase